MARRIQYDPQRHNQTIISQSMLGATDKQMAEAIGISWRTLCRWKNKHPEFLAALKNGKDVADGNVAMSLYRCATGYEQIVRKVFMYKGALMERDVVERVPPNPVACIYWLKNRQPHAWRDRPSLVAGEEDEPVKELLRAIRDSPKLLVAAVDPADVPVPAPS